MHRQEVEHKGPRRGSRARFSAAGIALSALLGLALGCGPKRQDGPNIVLILVDQLRKDSADEWLTEIHALGEEGVAFENMRAVAPWTYPSVISMFSGLYPQQHGANGNMQGQLLSTFSAGVPLVPRRLRAEGYHTAGFVTNPFLHTWNPFHEAFDHYDARFIRSEGNLRGFGDYVWTTEMYADTVNAAVTEYFDARPPAEPEFVYVHYIDVHGRGGPEPWSDAPFSGGYTEAVRWTDGKVRELYDYFMERYGGDVLFVVTSDHGQELQDDLAVGYGARWRKRKATVHDFNTRIPLYVLPSALVTGPRLVEANCANIDLAPTLLEWAGAEPFESIPGQSLVPLLEGSEPREERAIYSVMQAFGRSNDCVVLGDTKLMRHLDPTSGQVVLKRVFDLAEDPRETESIRSAFGKEGGLLLEAAGMHGIEFPLLFEAPDEELLRDLQDLGYLEVEGG